MLSPGKRSRAQGEVLKFNACRLGLSDLPGRHDPAGCSGQAGCSDHPVAHPGRAAGLLGVARLGFGSGSRCLLSGSSHEKEMASGHRSFRLQCSKSAITTRHFCASEANRYPLQAHGLRHLRDQSRSSQISLGTRLNLEPRETIACRSYPAVAGRGCRGEPLRQS